MNWRKKVIKILGKTNNVLGYLENLKQFEQTESLAADYRLKAVLRHAYENVPYYKTFKNRALGDLPFLTKDIIRRQGDRLYSVDRRKRHFYMNSSGGSAGEPITFLQDKIYNEWNTAHKLYLRQMQGLELGDREIKLWGSGRDIVSSNPYLLWLFNIKQLNAARMSNVVMEKYLKQWNEYKPVVVWTYVSSILEFARFVENKDVWYPKVIITSAETLTEDARIYIESVFRCRVVNQYGSREVGAIACECPSGGMHIFSLHNKVEIIDGEIIVTGLNNYSMPLIRYKIGDTATEGTCNCGLAWPTIGKVTGRIVDHFRTRDGEIIYGEAFTHLFYLSDVTKFRVVQEDYDYVKVYIVGTVPKGIAEQIKGLLGQQCKVNIIEVDELKPSSSGKYRYTISRVER